MLLLTTLTLIALVLIAIYLHTTEYDILGTVLLTISGLALIIHGCSWFISLYTYDRLVAKRYAISYTLDSTREHRDELENASVTRDVVRFNSSLLLYRTDNKDLFLGMYIDDRIETIELIE